MCLSLDSSVGTGSGPWADSLGRESVFVLQGESLLTAGRPLGWESLLLQGRGSMGGEAGRNPGLAPRALGAMEGIRAAEGQVGSGMWGGIKELLAPGGNREKSGDLSGIPKAQEGPPGAGAWREDAGDSP